MGRKFQFPKQSIVQELIGFAGIGHGKVPAVAKIAEGMSAV